MDVDEHKDLFTCCREGDVAGLRHLLQSEDVEVNIRDSWDSTPLYYACLCGHLSVVEYLLQNGAKCEANTFDGERCLYAALTNKIKSVLKSYKAITSTIMRRDTYREFFRRCLEGGYMSDMAFSVHGVVFKAHRIILSARCSFFAQMFQTRWREKTVVNLKHRLLTPQAFKAVLQYIYTGRVDIHVDHVDDCLRLAKQCKLFELTQHMSNIVQNAERYGADKLCDIKVISVEITNGKWTLEDSFGRLAERVIPEEFWTQQFPSLLEHFSLPWQAVDSDTEDCVSECSEDGLCVDDDGEALFSDISLNVGGHLFHCHKVFMCGRSEYFKGLIRHDVRTRSESSSDMEDISEDDVQCGEITLKGVRPDIFAIIVTFIYQNDCQFDSEEEIYETLFMAEMYLLSGLKRKCANALVDYLRVDNAVPMLKTARLFNLENLDARCNAFMATNFEKMFDRQDMVDLIREDASAIRQREDQDSIEIVDNLRYFIFNSALPDFDTKIDTETVEVRMYLLEELLSKLGISCARQ